MLPLEPPEVWCAGVTYERSRDARIEESAVEDVYSLVYDAERPELFLKDAACRRTVGPGEPIGVRSDSSWNVPEPEIALVLGDDGEIAGVTIGNDVSSRDIEGANPLYLPQAKVYAGACALGPAVLSPVPGGAARDPHARSRARPAPSSSRARPRPRACAARSPSSSSSSCATTRSRREASSSRAPASSRPTTSRSSPGHVVEIEVPGIGILSNPVVLASSLLERSAAHV